MRPLIGRITLLLAGTVLLHLAYVGTTPTATAAEDAAKTADGETLFMTKTCFTCHGKDGKTPLLPQYPKVAGQNAAYALQQMLDIKTGVRTNGQSVAMKGIMHLVNDEEMKVLSEYLENLAP